MKLEANGQLEAARQLRELVEKESGRRRPAVAGAPATCGGDGLEKTGQRKKKGEAKENYSTSQDDEKNGHRHRNEACQNVRQKKTVDYAWNDRELQKWSAPAAGKTEKVVQAKQKATSAVTAPPSVVPQTGKGRHRDGQPAILQHTQREKGPLKTP
jgi:hypothetical protein